jgi:hypothetical protein
MANLTANVGKGAFVIGVLFAIFGGIWGGKAAPTNEWVVTILLIAGVVIGLLNVTAREATAVLTATVALLVLGIWGDTSAFQPVKDLSQGLAENVIGVVDAFAMLMAPAAVIIALRAVIGAARPGD